MEFIHRFIPAAKTGEPVLLLLHGTGGTEDDLLDLGRSLVAGAALLSPRGRILENGRPRFFRRLAQGVFDEADIIRRAAELAEFVGEAARRYEFDARQVIAVGYSNGANIAAGLLLLHPGVLAGALLLRAMVPLVPEPLPDLDGAPIFLAAGEADPIVPPGNVRRLAALLEQAGARVELRWSPGGHGLSSEEIDAAREWLRLHAP